MSDERFNNAIADKLVAFYGSDLWCIIKKRINDYTNVLDTRALKELRNNNTNIAEKYANMSEGVKSTIDVAERIPGELINGKLDVDVALGVIENKPREQKEAISWPKKLRKLVKFKKKR